MIKNIKQLAEDKYPQSEISEIQRRAFIEGYEKCKDAGENPIKEHENTFFFTISDHADDRGDVPSDLKLEGNAERLMAGLAMKMLGQPDVENFFVYTLAFYDQLISDAKTKTNG